MAKAFNKSFTQQEAIDQESIALAMRVLKSGRLHRYNTLDDELSQVSLLEQEYALYQDAHYCLACASGGYALNIALRAAGLKSNEAVLTNMYTLKTFYSTLMIWLKKQTQVVHVFCYSPTCEAILSIWRILWALWRSII